MRKLKRIIIMICTTFFVVLLFQVGTHAAGNDFLTYSGTQSGIDMGFDTMNEARNNCYTYELPNSSGVIASNATITKAYDFHIYKIHINDTGYYSFYTTGDSDTMINNYVNSEVVNSKLRYFIDAENILKVYDINTDISVGISSFIMGLCGPEGKVASFFYSTILEIFYQVVSMKTSLVNSFFEKIGKECQIKTRLTSLSKAGLTSIMTTERNLCVERWFTNTLTMQYSYSVSSYSKNETLIYGQEYTDGIWS